MDKQVAYTIGRSGVILSYLFVISLSIMATGGIVGSTALIAAVVSFFTAIFATILITDRWY